MARWVSTSTSSPRRTRTRCPAGSTRTWPFMPAIVPKAAGRVDPLRRSRGSRRLVARLVAPVYRHDARAAEPQVMLQAHLRPLHLALVRHAPELPHELRALREPRRPEGMALRQKPSGRI